MLGLLVPQTQIVVRPPLHPDELSFDGLHDEDAIRKQLLDVARMKCDDVCTALDTDGDARLKGEAVVITADTIVVARDRTGTPVVLGQPPEDSSWERVVQGWFVDYLAGRPHAVLTGLCVVLPDGERVETIATTEVTFRADVDRFLDWYLSTGEPRGKAGGYAIQGAGSVFVESVRGSLSNVIGLPLEELQRILGDAGIGFEEFASHD